MQLSWFGSLGRSILIWLVASAVALAWADLAVAFGLQPEGLGSESVRIATQSVALFSGAFMLTRLLHAVFWHGTVLRRTGFAAPRLLTDLVDGLILVSAVVVIIAFIFDKPVTGLIATSGVAVAVVGFALKSIISDLFSGIAITLERPFRMGDWIDVGGGVVGKVTNLSWRACGLMQENGVYVVIPNGRLSEATLKVYDRPEAPWRDEVDITLGYEVTAHQIERILLSAAADVPEVAALQRKADARIVEFGDSGVKWRLRYWVPDYPSRSGLRYAVQRNILRNLHFSGITPPVPQLHARLSRSKGLAMATSGTQEFLARVFLLRMLDAAEMSELAENSDLRLVPEGVSVVNHGEDGNSLFIIKEGLFEVLIPDKNGDNIMVARLKSGAFFGEMSLLTGAPRGATVRAAVDSMLIEITKDALQPILLRRDSLMEAMSSALAERQLQNSKAATQELREEDSHAAQQTLAAQLLGRMRSFFGRS